MVSGMISTHAQCGKTINYHGNSTGHCDQCCETFYGESAFDRHQVHNRADGKPTCIPPSKYTPGPSGNTFWADHEGQWHYGQPVDAEERRLRGEARAAHMAESRCVVEKSRPTGSKPYTDTTTPILSPLSHEREPAA